ncbi:LLM class flavin-dependent oxidoreductase [Sphingobium fuliginis ATCC 27551]|uniref:LLM class flavin-dependent oxidoreductase n=2 Tax=Sphingobium fuliginis (strain ATCC 27551) TaxID=336203 RepID=A0A5B8CLC2_SPHSA|nr:LLM class flavin-dependent oxidoreductase [Sphingobium fuliginis ATCC 27551]
MPPPCDRRGPLFGPNPMKLGVFGLNVSSAGGITGAKDRHRISWNQNVQLVKAAEAAGFEAAVPIARWRGFEGRTNPWGESFEPYTWAAGLAAVTKRIAVVSTSHVLTVSPVMAAKQISTIDHISNGRAVLNTVSGWFQKELRMFGVGALDHDERYAYAAEWMEILLRLWTQNETFDFQGRHVSLLDGYQQPKSVQVPRPPVMNAAFSPVGHAFAARWADIAFVSPDSGSAASARDKVLALRQLAAERDRQIQIWVSAAVMCADTDQAARSELHRFLEEEGDPEALANLIEWTMGGARIPEEKRKTVGSGYPLVGSPDRIADQIAMLSDAGVDGLCMTFMNYEQGLGQFIGTVLPLLTKGGLRYKPSPAGDESDVDRAPEAV